LKKLSRLFFAVALSALALLPTLVEARPPGVYYVCVESCLECWNYPGPCPNAYCEELVFGCEETFGIACHCNSY
jgi:hypothetical protein